MVNIIVAGLAGGVACGIGLAWALLPAIPFGVPLAGFLFAAMAAIVAVCWIRHYWQPSLAAPSPAAADHSREIRELLTALDRLNRNRVADGAEATPRQLVKGE